MVRTVKNKIQHDLDQVILFTNEQPKLTETKIENNKIQWSKEVHCLKITIDNKLTFNLHFKKAIKKAKGA